MKHEKKHKNKVMAARECEIMMPVALHSESSCEVAEGPLFLEALGNERHALESLLHTKIRD